MWLIFQPKISIYHNWSKELKLVRILLDIEEPKTLITVIPNQKIGVKPHMCVWKI